ncbi:MAG: glutamate-5-semialdehyde dehydrogenase [Oscillospiraceae bacterium]|nr:glutamate-5-semialdehyde dehydrogenase [Oscillospiraceae bacterium]
MTQIEILGRQAATVRREIATASTNQKNKALISIAEALTKKMALILEANQKDLAAAEASGMPSSLQDRLKLDEKRIMGMAEGVYAIADLTDPIGKTDFGFTRPNGLRIAKTRVPLGVIGIIYEARPNVTVDAAALCLKAGNAVILRGGKEAFFSNQCLTEIMREALTEIGMSADIIQLVGDTSRESATELMRLNRYLDVLIPRGGQGLIRSVVENATVPVIETGTGNCHIYVDEFADLSMAVEIHYNAKTSRPSVCNAAEGVLVHQAVAEKFLPMMKSRLDEKAVTLYGDPETVRILGDTVFAADEAIYATEFLDYKLSVKVVADIEEAVDHIEQYGTRHSEAIITDSIKNADYFTANVDAAAVYVNASTRFTDGGEFGFGAEIGISTQKLHARGPMGINELTTVKYIVNGNGQIR